MSDLLTYACDECTRLREHGRNTGAPIHCLRCHLTWTGNEAQHCMRCHHTFASTFAADKHRYRKGEDRCIDPATTEGWHEKRSGVWTYGQRPSITQVQSISAPLAPSGHSDTPETAEGHTA